MRLLCFLFINILLGYSITFVKGENLFQGKKGHWLKERLQSSQFHIYNGHQFLRFASLEKDTMNVVFLGGSITYNPGWRNDLEEYFTAQFPEKVICCHNKGIPSLGSVAHAFRYVSDVLSQVKPDILFYESVVNDHANAYSEKDQAKAVESIIRRSIVVNPDMDIIMMYFADPDKLADYKKGIIPDEICLQNKIAAYYEIPVIDISREVYERIQAGEFSWTKDIKDLHPSPFGQKIYSSSMKVMLDSLLLGGNHAVARKLPPPLNERYYRHAQYESVKNGKGTFKYYSRYIPDNGQPTRAGFTDVPMLVGENPGEEFVYEFEGTTIGICYISGNDAGIIRYRVDGGEYQVMDLYTKYSDRLHVPEYVILKDDLNEGKHKIEVEILKEKNENSKGNACRVVHFLVN